MSTAGGDAVAVTSVVGEDLAESRDPEPPWEAGSDTAHNGLERPRALSIQSTGGEVGLSAALLPEADTAAGGTPGPKGEGDAAKSSMVGASFNFINSIVGAGIVGMPFALRQAGFGFGIVLILLMGWLTEYSVTLLISCGLRSGKMNYQEVVEASLGKPGYHILSFAQFMFPFFGMIAYGIIVGQTLPKVFDVVLGTSFLSDRQAVIVVMTFCVMLPLSSNKDIAKLSRFSALAMFGVLVIVLVTLIRGQQIEAPPGRGENPYNFIAPNVAQALGIMAFAYVCHHNSFLIYESLENTSVKRFQTVTRASVGIAALLSIMLGAGGYAAFGFATEADVLDNFPEDDVAANVARFFFTITIMLTYPIECFVIREVLETYLHYLCRSVHEDVRHYGLTIVVCMMAMVLSLSLENLGIVLELNGIVNANMLAFILPGLCAMRQLPGDHWYSRPKWGPLLLVLFGVTLFVVGLVTVILSEVGGGE